MMRKNMTTPFTKIATAATLTMSLVLWACPGEEEELAPVEEVDSVKEKAEAGPQLVDEAALADSAKAEVEKSVTAENAEAVAAELEKELLAGD